MAEAFSTLQQAQIRAKMHMATYVLARQAAIKATKLQLQRQGLRVSHFTHCELMRRAEAYLDNHRAELIAEAKPIVERWRQEGFFGKRAASPSFSNITSDAQGGKA